MPDIAGNQRNRQFSSNLPKWRIGKVWKINRKWMGCHLDTMAEQVIQHCRDRISVEPKTRARQHLPVFDVNTIIIRQSQVASQEQV